jgi:hypothetical protein
MTKNEKAFFLGQRHAALGALTLYEFDFEGSGAALTNRPSPYPCARLKKECAVMVMASGAPALFPICGLESKAASVFGNSTLHWVRCIFRELGRNLHNEFYRSAGVRIENRYDLGGGI